MPRSDQDESPAYRVVVNHEEQFSIWLANKPLPIGWTDAGKTGSQSECLSYIKEVWTDLRPLSLRRQMEQRQMPPPSVKR